MLLIFVDVDDTTMGVNSGGLLVAVDAAAVVLVGMVAFAASAEKPVPVVVIMQLRRGNPPALPATSRGFPSWND